MTPADIIVDVRSIILDNHATLPNRISDTVLLSYVNQAIKRMVVFRPDLFVTFGDITLVQDHVDQVLPSTAVRLMELFRIKTGNAIREVNREALDQNYPGWASEASGTVKNWMRHPRTPTRFFVYPAPDTAVVLTGEYVDTPADVLLAGTINLPLAYFPVLVDGTVFVAESQDNESIGNGRAKFYYDAFVEALGSDFSQRVVVDSESGMVGATTQRSRTQQVQTQGA